MHDSLRLQLREDSARIHRPLNTRLFLKVEDRYSFVSRERVNMFGIMSGITIRDHHTIFLGFFFLDPFNIRVFTIDGITANRQQFLNLKYGVLGYQYVVHKSRYWQVNTPVAVGFGTYQVEVQNPIDNTSVFSSGHIWPASAGLQVIYKPFTWIGLSVSGGYRYITQQENTNLSLKGWYYSFGIWLDGRIVSRHIRYHRKKQIFRRHIEKNASI